MDARSAVSGWTGHGAPRRQCRQRRAKAQDTATKLRMRTARCWHLAQCRAVALIKEILYTTHAGAYILHRTRAEFHPAREQVDGTELLYTDVWEGRTRLAERGRDHQFAKNSSFGARARDTKAIITRRQQHGGAATDRRESDPEQA